MTRYSIQPRDRIFVKSYRFLPFTRNIGENIGKNLNKNWSSKCSQTRLHHAKQLAADAPKSYSKRGIQKTVEATGDLIGNKIVNRITKVSKTSLHNHSVTIEEEIFKRRYISLKKNRKLLMIQD